MRIFKLHKIGKSCTPLSNMGLDKLSSTSHLNKTERQIYRLKILRKDTVTCLYIYIITKSISSIHQIYKIVPEMSKRRTSKNIPVIMIFFSCTHH